MIDLQAVRDANQCREISNVGFLQRHNNLEDGMAKPSKYMPMHDSLRTGKENFTIDQTNTTARSNLAYNASNAEDDSCRHHPINNEQLTAEQIKNNCNTHYTAYYSSNTSHPELSRVLGQHSKAHSSMNNEIKDSSTQRSRDHQQFISYKPGELVKRSCGSIETANVNQAV